MIEYKFRITYQHGETGRIVQKFIVLGEPIQPNFDGWSLIGKDQFAGILDVDSREMYGMDYVQDMGDLDKKIYRVVWGGYWNDMGFGIERRRKEDESGSRPFTWDLLNPTWSSTLRIVGNCYENPELGKEVEVEGLNSKEVFEWISDWER